MYLLTSQLTNLFQFSSLKFGSNFNFCFYILQVVIVKLKMDKDRKKIVERRAKGRLAALGKDKGKYTEESAASPSTVTPMETA